MKACALFTKLGLVNETERRRQVHATTPARPNIVLSPQVQVAVVAAAQTTSRREVFTLGADSVCSRTDGDSSWSYAAVGICSTCCDA